jgi:hypothetical protein
MTRVKRGRCFFLLVSAPADCAVRLFVFLLVYGLGRVGVVVLCVLPMLDDAGRVGHVACKQRAPLLVRHLGP